MIALDTTAFIDMLKGNQELGKIIEEINLPLVTTMVNYMELMIGLNFERKKHKEEEKLIDGIFDSIRVFDLDKNSCKKSSKLFWDQKKKGRSVDETDCTIAGTLLSNGINKIITRNVKHFEKIKGLEVISY